MGLYDTRLKLHENDKYLLITMHELYINAKKNQGTNKNHPKKTNLVLNSSGKVVKENHFLIKERSYKTTFGKDTIIYMAEYKST